MSAVREYNPQLFSRMLAKIGHAFVVAELGQRGFKPLLPELILGIEVWKLGYFIGGLPDLEPRSAYTTEIGLRRWTDPNGTEYVGARFRLFGDMEGPTYLIVVGKL